MNIFDLSIIVEVDIPGITKNQAQHHLEACVICLDYHDHETPLALLVSFVTEETIALNWNSNVTHAMRRSWNDLKEATEFGAVAMAIFTIFTYTSYTIVERAVQGSGFDYWLSETEISDESDGLILGNALLEVSGILKGNDDAISRRFKQKQNQIRILKGSFPHYIVVVEFQKPQVHIWRIET